MQVAYGNIFLLRKKEKGEQSKEKLILLYLILMSVLWLSHFRRTQLLRWSDWITGITCLESPMRQLIDNAWHKNIFVYSQIWLCVRFQSLVFPSETWFTGGKVNGGESPRSGGFDWEPTVASDSIGTHTFSTRGSYTSYSSHSADVVLEGI